MVVAKSAQAAATSAACATRDARKVTRGEALRTMQRAAQGYTAYPPKFHSWLQQASQEESEKRALLLERQTHDAIADLEKERLRQQEIRERGHPPKLAFSTCTYTDRQKHELDRLSSGDMFGRTPVVQLRKAAMTAPKPLSSVRANEYDDQVLVVAAQAQRPWWLSYLCACRKAFQGAAIKIGEGDNAKYYKFLYAKQKPLQAAFAPLRLLEPEYTQCIDYSAELGDDFELPHAWEYRFACDYMDVVQAHTIDSDTNSALAVLPGLHDLFGQSMVVTDGPTIWLNDFIYCLPELQKARVNRDHEKPAKMPSVKKKQTTGADDFVAKHPWIAQAHPAAKKRKVDAGAARGEDSDGEGSDSQASDGSAGSDSESEDLVVDEVFAELQAARDKWHADHGHHGG